MCCKNMESKIVLILFTLIVNHVGNMTAISARNFLGMEQSILVNFEIQDPDHLIHSTSTESVILCMTECTQNSECLSFSYNIVSLACRLYSAVYGSNEKGTGTTGTRHYNVGEDGKRHANMSM